MSLHGASADNSAESERRSRSRWLSLLLIAAMLVAVNGLVFLADRTLIPMTSTPGILPGGPSGYAGPMPKSPTTMDPFASFCANFAYDAYTVNTVKKGEL
ncbi:MAG: hypothetical protein JRF65_03110, partial [Deltaproteobacteria bacterium]|nr:hypothetical protein [Deltaproteobacteria bacterium]